LRAELRKRGAKSDPKLDEVEQQRAALLRKMGRDEEALELLAGGARSFAGARQLEKAGRFDEALAAYVELGEREAALQVLPRAGLEPRAKAKVLADLGRPLEAAALLEAAQLFPEAAEAYSAAGDPERAASAWQRAGEGRRAAEAWMAAGRPQEAVAALEATRQYADAAELARRLGDLRGAARLLQLAGRPIEAAALLLDANERDAATRLLRQVKPGTPQAARATVMLVPLLLERGEADDALTRLNSLPPETDPGGDTELERLYWQAQVLERLGRDEEARRNLRKVVAIRRDFRDAADCLARVDHRLRGAAAAPAATRAAWTPPAAPARPATEPTVAAQVVAPAGATFGAWVPGSIIAGRWELLAEIGRGGMGRVYRAHDRELDEIVAIKTLHQGGEEGREEEERLLREVQICRRLAHPNIVRVYDLGRFEGGIFLTMELVEGQRLDDYERARHPLALSEVRAAVRQVAAGLAEAHAHDVVHRDLKPSNVILAGGIAKILDFGIARRTTTESRLTQTGQAIGTPAYMSPEQIQGGPLDGRSDLYSLGVLTYFLLTGAEPFTGPSPMVVAIQHLQTQPPDPRELRPDLPEPWSQFVSTLLAKQPEARPAFAALVGNLAERLPG
jgi:tetratricopeptide (TPR) repeat protein